MPIAGLCEYDLPMISRKGHTAHANLGHMFFLGASALLAMSLIPYLHEFWWVFELPSHFRPHIAVLSTALGIIALAMKHWRASMLAGVTATICWAIILPELTTTAVSNSGAIVLSQNLYYGNSRKEEMQQMLAEEDPDILVLLEYTPEWHQLLTSTADQYHTTITSPKEGAFGIAVYSRLPVRSREVLSLGETKAPAIVIEIDSPDASTFLVAVHLQPPMTDAWSADRDRQLGELSRYLQALDGEFIVVGDFNNTPFSPSLREFVRDTKTSISLSGWQPTWPTALGWAGIPIDLALGSKGVTIGPITTLDSIGPDHRGLRFSIATSQSAITNSTS